MVYRNDCLTIVFGGLSLLCRNIFLEICKNGTGGRFKKKTAVIAKLGILYWQTKRG